MSRHARVFLVRHADTVFTEQGLIHGSLDSPLSEEGLRQSGLTAERLRGENFDAFYSSPLGRAMATATIIGEAVDMKPIPVPGLAERDFGWMEGWPLPRAHSNALLSRLRLILIRMNFALSGERRGDFEARVAGALQMILNRHPDGRILTVTHWGVLTMIMHLLVGGDWGQWAKSADWSACGISEIQRQDKHWQTVYLNDSRHLEREGN
jgi:broad specificity phosphatase PhoE